MNQFSYILLLNLYFHFFLNKRSDISVIVIVIVIVIVVVFTIISQDILQIRTTKFAKRNIKQKNPSNAVELTQSLL